MIQIIHSAKKMTFFVWCSGCLWSAATQPIAIDTLVRQTLEANPAIRMAEQEVAAARGARVSAGAWRNPELSAQAGSKKARDSENILQGDGIAFAVQLSQTFEWPGKGTLRKAIADRDVAIAEEALGQFRRSLEARVRGLAIELVALDEQQTLAAAVVRDAEAIIVFLRERPKTGPQPIIESQLIEAAVIELRKKAIEMETRAEAVRIELNQLRGFPLSSPLKIEGSKLRIPLPRDLKKLLLAGGSSHPTIRLRAMELEHAGLRLRQARLSAAPDITVGPFYSREEAGDVETTIGASLSIPLPLWGQGLGQIEQARAREQFSIAALALAQREAEAEMTRLHRESMAAAQLLNDVTEARIDEFREAAELASRQYRTGGIPVQLYLEMQREFLGVTALRWEALTTVIRNDALLEQFTATQHGGKP